VKIETDKKLDFSDVLIRPRPSALSSRRDVDITRKFSFPHSATTWSGFPLVASNMDVTGTLRMAKALSEKGALTALSKYYELDDLVKFFHTRESDYAFYSMGITTADLDKLNALKEKISIAKICIEVANGYIPDVAKFVATVRKQNPTSVIMAGSVCTPEMTTTLLQSGADIIRVGISSGSVCITRKIAGVGYPQLSAILECSEAAHQENGFVCSDGGCIVPGDVCKAFGAGADFVMLGGMLAGHAECEGTIKYKKKGRKKIPVSMQFYGMASIIAQKKHFGGVASYRALEGKVVDVPYRGNVAETVQEIAGGLRSMMTYIDARDLSEVATKTTFIKVGNQTNNVYGK
jgi:GMP reductase